MTASGIGRRGWRLLGSSGFFWAVIALFVLQAAWIALTGRYPQAFDEQFHFGVIQLHAHQWWPFFTHQPSGSIGLGAVVSDPSFLYHYLMSFPYRLIRIFTSDQTIQLILLRLINVALAACGLLTYRAVLKQLKLPAAWANGLILSLAFLPVFPLLAGQLNYDNLLLPLCGLALLQALKVDARYTRNGRLDWSGLGRLLALSLFASAVKYTYLPIFLGLAVFFAPRLWRQRGVAGQQIAAALRSANRVSLGLLLGLMLIGLGLVAGSYGVDLVRYHSITPKCNQVLSIERCSNYGPWYRDYLLEQQNPAPSLKSILAYPYDWAVAVVHETYFTIYSYFDAHHTVIYKSALPVRALIITGWVWFLGGTAVVLWQLKTLLRRPATRLFLLVSVLYLGALFVVNFLDFVRTDTPVAIHGRYIFPVTIPLMACMVVALRELAKRYSLLQRRWVRRIFTAAIWITLLLLTQGGGFITYEIRSSDAWFWPQSRLAQTANAHIRGFLRAVVVTD